MTTLPILIYEKEAGKLFVWVDDSENVVSKVPGFVRIEGFVGADLNGKALKLVSQKSDSGLKKLGIQLPSGPVGFKSWTISNGTISRVGSGSSSGTSGSSNTDLNFEEKGSEGFFTQYKWPIIVGAIGLAFAAFIIFKK